MLYQPSTLQTKHIVLLFDVILGNTLHTNTVKHMDDNHFKQYEPENMCQHTFNPAIHQFVCAVVGNSTVGNNELLFMSTTLIALMFSEGVQLFHIRHLVYQLWRY